MLPNDRTQSHILFQPDPLYIYFWRWGGALGCGCPRYCGNRRTWTWRGCGWLWQGWNNWRVCRRRRMDTRNTTKAEGLLQRLYTLGMEPSAPLASDPGPEPCRPTVCMMGDMGTSQRERDREGWDQYPGNTGQYIRRLVMEKFQEFLSFGQKQNKRKISGDRDL